MAKLDAFLKPIWLMYSKASDMTFIGVRVFGPREKTVTDGRGLGNPAGSAFGVRDKHYLNKNAIRTKRIFQPRLLLIRVFIDVAIQRKRERWHLRFIK